MNFSEMKKLAQEESNRVMRELKKEGSKFITSEAPMLAYDVDGRLEDKGYNGWADGQSGEKISELTMKKLDKAVRELLIWVEDEERHHRPVDKDSVEISLYGTLRGYESIASYKDYDEHDRADFDVVIWTLKDGIVCRNV